MVVGVLTREGVVLIMVDRLELLKLLLVREVGERRTGRTACIVEADEDDGVDDEMDLVDSSSAGLGQ